MTAVCCVPVSPLRSEPNHRSEMVSELIFGEACETLGTAPGEWTHVRCSYDGYEGWCIGSHLEQVPDYPVARSLTMDWVTKISYNGAAMQIPLGSEIQGFKNGVLLWQKNQLRYDGKGWNPITANKGGLAITGMAHKFLNTTYLWGGKSVFGTDCSGYTQTVYKFFNIPLKRDAWMQAEQGSAVASLQESVCGDLAFFENEKGRIVHVGILLGDRQIIHASGKVRVDTMDERGIIHSQSRQLTHVLTGIRRFF